MRLAVYADYPYHREDGAIYAERAFSIFLSRLGPMITGLVLIGRLTPAGGNARYPIGDADFVELPYYPKLSQHWRAIPAMARSFKPFWRSLQGVDCVWVLGPHLLGMAFALLALARRRRVVLGVRQNLPAYTRSRHPRRFDLHVAAWLLEGSFRLLSRFLPVVAVGPEIARNYRHSRRLMELAVSLVSEADLVTAETAAGRSYDGELQILSVGRVDAEKNPLLLAEALARLNQDEPRWRLVVCGEGDLEANLAVRLEELGQTHAAQLRGYVPFRDLRRLYLDSHVLLHSSWTEGLPQVLLEAFAAGLPVVAADVGGIRASVGDAALLVPAGDAKAAAEAVESVVRDQALRERLVGAGLEFARARTSEAELERLAGFLTSSRS